MKLFAINRNVMSGQCKGALLRLQIRYTAIFFLCMFRGWAGSQIGLFTPKKVNGEYRCTGFYFHPWFAPDIAVCQLPRWYTRVARALSFGVILAAFSLSGCTLQQAKANVEAQVSHDIAVQIAPAAVPDLLKVRDEANAQNPPDTYLASCMQDVASFLQALAAQNPPSLFGGGALDANGCKPTEYFDAAANKCKTGAALLAYQGYLAAHAPPAPTLAIPDSLIADCAPPAARVQKDINAFLIQFGVDLAGFKGAAAFGSQQTLQAVRNAGLHP